MIRATRLLLILVALWVCFGSSAQAQTTGSISGQVKDEKQGSLPNASVTVRKVSTGESRTAQTDSEGRYRFTNMPVGEYEITVEASGFAKYVQTGVTLLLNLPFAVWGWPRWTWFFEYNAIREIEPSLYLLFGADPRASVVRANAISALAVAGAALALAVIELRTRRLDPLPAACALVCVFLIANKVYSPQYWLWVVALVALAALPGWLASAVSVLSLTDYAISFARLHLQADRVWAQAAWFDQAVFWPMVAIRYAALSACAVWAFAHSVRKREVPTA